MTTYELYPAAEEDLEGTWNIQLIESYYLDFGPTLAMEKLSQIEIYYQNERLPYSHIDKPSQVKQGEITSNK